MDMVGPRILEASERNRRGGGSGSLGGGEANR